MTLSDYIKTAGYEPKPGERCPECKVTCGPGGPDHMTTCALLAKLWAADQGGSASSIPKQQLELGANPTFQAWVAKTMNGLFTGPRALPVVPRVDPAQTKPRAEGVSEDPITAGQKAG